MAKTKTSPEIKEEILYPFPDVEFAHKWGEWLLDRRERRIKPYTSRGLKGAFNNLYEISGGDVIVAIKIIQQSIDQGWQGLFPLRNKNTNGHGKQSEKLTGTEIKDAISDYTKGW